MVKRLKLSIYLLSLLAIAIIGMGIHAQDRNDYYKPLHIVDSGYLYAWWQDDLYLEQLTFDGYIQAPTMSPDGNLIAFNLHSNRDFVVWGGYEVGQDVFPSDIYMWDIDAYELVQVTEQDGEEGDTIVRSEPSWSDDGQKLVWYEVVFGPSETYEIDSRYGVYDFEQQSMTYLDAPGGGIDAGNYAMWRGIWAGNSITQFAWGVSPVQYMQSVNLDGEIIYVEPVGHIDHSTGEFSWASGPFNIREEGQNYIGLLFKETAQWDMIDPYTGFHEPIRDGVIKMYARTAPSALSLIIQPSDREQWEVMAYDDRLGDYIARLTFPGQYRDITQLMAISAEGERIAYINEDKTVSLWIDGKITQVEGINNATNVVWGASVWRILREPNLVPDRQSTWLTEGCDTDGVVVGSSGVLKNRYIEGYREAYPFRFGVYFDDYAEFTVVDGPVCSDDNLTSYWKINTENTTAWVLNDNRMSTVLHLTGCPNGFVSQIGTYAGKALLVPDTSANNLREEAGLDGEIITQIQPGDTVRLTGAHTECADGYLWYWVEYNDEYGWTAEGDLNGYWLIPEPPAG